MKILCIGEALIDMICTDKNSSLSEGNHFLKKPGGAPTNVAAAIAALGEQVVLAAKVGNDPFGKQLIETMQSFGVDTSAMLTHNDYFTTFAFVSLMEDGERDFVFNRGADEQLTIDDIDAINLNEVSIIHFGSATGFLPGTLQAAYLHLLQKAIHHRIYISFDPNYRHLLFKNNTASFITQSWYYLQHCNFFKVSFEEALLITETDTLEKAMEILFTKTKGVFAITLGKEGTLLGLNGEQYMIESITVQPIDTTGAGDAFVGAVLYQLNQFPTTEIKNLPFNEWKKIIYNANKAGARTCEYLGAMEAFKHLNNKIFNS
ncbi:MAG: carbohydrate kinase [Sphingobacteriia bacterium]|nr:MAG: carbohydrate kinase [Sphingobacteriia bacterium]TAH07128.1 MAG: carbohydrate kinase [Sphingobacteriia bacterium]